MAIKIQVLRWRPQDGDMPSRILDVAASYGTPLGASLSDGTYFRLADTQAGSRNFLGLLTRDVVSGGPTFVERMTGVRNAPNEAGTAGMAGLELPDKVGGYTTARMPEEIEAEGSEFLLTSGTGKLDAAGQSTAIPGTTEIAIVNGKYRIKQAGDGAVGVITAKGLDDQDGTTLRVRIKFY